MSEVVVFSGGPHPLVATPGESFEIARRDSIIEVAAAAALRMQLTAKDAAVAAAPRNLLPQMLPQLQLVQAAVSTC